jgi:hypothetical protein
MLPPAQGAHVNVLMLTHMHINKVTYVRKQ